MGTEPTFFLSLAPRDLCYCMGSGHSTLLNSADKVGPHSRMNRPLEKRERKHGTPETRNPPSEASLAEVRRHSACACGSCACRHQSAGRNGPCRSYQRGWTKSVRTENRTRGNPLFVAIYRGSQIRPGFLRWCRILAIHRINGGGLALERHFSARLFGSWLQSPPCTPYKG